MSFLAVTDWQLGEVERARELIDRANPNAQTDRHHVLTVAIALLREIRPGNVAATTQWQR